MKITDEKKKRVGEIAAAAAWANLDDAWAQRTTRALMRLEIETGSD